MPKETPNRRIQRLLVQRRGKEAEKWLMTMMVIIWKVNLTLTNRERTTNTGTQERDQTTTRDPRRRLDLLQFAREEEEEGVEGQRQGQNHQGGTQGDAPHKKTILLKYRCQEEHYLEQHKRNEKLTFL